MCPCGTATVKLMRIPAGCAGLCLSVISAQREAEAGGRGVTPAGGTQQVAQQDCVLASFLPSFLFFLSIYFLWETKLGVSCNRQPLETESQNKNGNNKGLEMDLRSILARIKTRHGWGCSSGLEVPLGSIPVPGSWTKRTVNGNSVSDSCRTLRVALLPGMGPRCFPSVPATPGEIPRPAPCWAPEQRHSVS